jgi:hypothetical protein
MTSPAAFRETFRIGAACCAKQDPARKIPIRDSGGRRLGVQESIVDSSAIEDLSQ